MLFNSYEFLIFFPVVTLIYYLVPHAFRWLHLLVASCIFYAAFIPSYLLILFFLIAIDYTAGLLIEKSNQKRFWLITSVACNIGLLGIFKYYNFFISNLNALTGADMILLHWVLPVGLSFHTFQSISYTIEVYKGKQRAITHPGYYALYVMFYPQLVAGPIERPQHLLPQLFEAQKFSFSNLYPGLRLMAWGFFKKLVIADRVAVYADAVFGSPAQAGWLQVWLGVFLFSIQIYADFSGYSDIAIGAAKTMGIDLTTNFNRPYFSRNIREFWKRWHISLSGWFRDYVYIPLGGNRKGLLRTRVNLVITFLLSAIWHGAGWTFIIWGILHAVYTLIFDGFGNSLFERRIPQFVSWLITWACVGFAWIFFRAHSPKAAGEIVKSGLQGKWIALKDITALPSLTVPFGNFTLLLSFVMIGYMLLVEKFTDPKLSKLDTNKITDLAVFSSALLFIIFFGVFEKSSFIYFQF